MAIYQGETITMKATFKDEDGSLITNLGDYTISAVVYNSTPPNHIENFEHADLSISTTNATATITIPPASSASLCGYVIIEIRLVDSNGSKIGQSKQAFRVMQTKIKNY